MNALADWTSRAERLLDAALSALRSGEDALPLTSAAETALRISVGELPEAEMDGYLFPGEARASRCVCPPALKARGGFTSACPDCAPALARRAPVTATEPALGLPQIAAACPTCQAQPGDPCTSHSGTRPRRHDTHQTRTAAWASAGKEVAL